MSEKEIAAEFGISIIQVQSLKKSVTKKLNENDIVHFLSFCKSSGLDPFRKEIAAYKDIRGRLVITTGRDGFLTMAQRNEAFKGMRSMEVCENDDEFFLDIPSGKVSHRVDPRKKRGKIIGAYSIAFRKEGESTIEWADFKTYTTDKDVWKSNPADMIKKVAESHALKKAFGVSGIQSEHDFAENKEGYLQSVSSENKEVDELEELKGLFKEKAKNMGTDYIDRVRSVIENKEESSYKKIIKDLKEK